MQGRSSRSDAGFGVSSAKTGAGRRVRWAAAAVVVAFGGLCLLATGAAAKLDGYTTPINLSQAGQNSTIPNVAVAPDARASVVWNVRGPVLNPLEFLRVNAGGNPGTVDTLTDQASEPQLAVDQNGRTTVVWTRLPGPNNSVRAMQIDAAGNTGPAHTLSPAGQNARFGQLAVDPDGRATVVWQRSDGSNERVQTLRIDQAGNPGPVRTLSAAGRDATLPQVAVDPQGRATVVWQRSDGSDERVQAVQLDAAGNPGTIHTLSAGGQDAVFPDVAVGPGGRATAVWFRVTPSGDPLAQSVQLDPAGNPGTVRTLSDPAIGAFLPRVAVDPTGRATVVWYAFASPTPARIQSVQLDPGGNPGTVHNLSAAGQNAFFPNVVVDRFGHATAVWYRFDEAGHRRAQAARLDPAGNPGTVHTLSAPGQNAINVQVDVDPQGRATVVWQRFDGSKERVQTSRGIISRPTTSIDSGPAEGEVLEQREATFTFSGAPPADIAGFECSLDGGPFSPCTSPHTVEDLANGPHDFAVRAVDVDGDRDLVGASRSFSVAAPVVSAKLQINRAQVRGARPKNRRLVVRGSLDERAAGERLTVRFRAAGRQIVVRPTVRPDGRFVVRRALRGPQRRAGAGRLQVRFAGNATLRAVGDRLRAARRAVKLRVNRVRLQGSRLVVAGRVLPLARRQARVQIELNQPNGDPAEIRARARVNRRGRFRTRIQVPAAVQAGGAWVAVTHPGRARLFGQRLGRGVGG